MDWRRARVTPPRLELWMTGRRGRLAAGVLYQPRRRGARLAHVAGASLTRASRAVSTLPDAVDRVLDKVTAEASIDYDSAAALHVLETNRWIFALLSEEGDGTVVKLGQATDAGLSREADTLCALAPRPASLRFPRVRWRGQVEGWHGFAEEMLRRSTGVDPTIADALEIAVDLATAAEGFVVHGDLAPWNIVPTSDGFALIDWESSRFAEDPLYDLAHYVTRTGCLLGTWSAAGAVEHLTAAGSAGWRYMDRIGRDPQTVRADLRRYLDGASARGDAGELLHFETEMAARLGDADVAAPKERPA